MSLVFLSVNDRAAGMGLAFFGFCDTLNGWLIVKSTFLPRWLGVITLIGGLGWMTFAYPPLGSPPLGPLWTSGIAGHDRMATGKRCGRRTVEGSAGILKYGTIPFRSPIPVIESPASQVGSRLRSAATAGTMGWTRVLHRAFGLQQRYRVR